MRTIRPIKKGDEILDNYGYHYAVMAKGERQKTLSGQYFFNCQCTACYENWPMYAKIPTSLEILTGLDEKATMAEHHKLVKNYKKAFDNVLQGSYADALPALLEYLNFLDQVIVIYLKSEINSCYIVFIPNFYFSYIYFQFYFPFQKFKRPVRDYNDCQEAIKQCYSAMANTHFQKSSKKDVKDN